MERARERSEQARARTSRFEKKNALAHTRNKKPTKTKKQNALPTQLHPTQTQKQNSAHHGVRISDRALVAAAELSNRYITARVLPDKAIDLVDEAAANQRVQLDSMPEFMDELQRRQLRLRIEEQALSKEKDKASEARLAEVRRELADLHDALAPLAAKYSREKERLDSIRALQKKRDELLIKLAEAERRQDLPLAADLKFGALTEVEAALKAAVEAVPADSMLSEEVGPEGEFGLFFFFFFFFVVFCFL